MLKHLTNEYLPVLEETNILDEGKTKTKVKIEASNLRLEFSRVISEDTRKELNEQSQRCYASCEYHQKSLSLLSGKSGRLASLGLGRLASPSSFLQWIQIHSCILIASWTRFMCALPF